MKAFIPIMAAVAILVLLTALVLGRKLGGVQVAPADESSTSFYDLKTRTLEGESVHLAKYQGQVALVVNLASKCGLTPQYEGLEALFLELAPRGFVILGFPSNDFMGQEPGTPAEIRSFCSTRYQVTFPLFEKVKVKGSEKGEIYQWLTTGLKEPDWNFTKYLIDPAGRVVYRFGPRTRPDDKDLRSRIEELLNDSPLEF